MALTFTQNDLDALKEALVTGASEVRIGDRTIKYKSNKEIREAIAMVQSYLDNVSSDDDPDTIQASFSKGAK